MKFVWLGYADEKLWASMPNEERDSMSEECFAYNDFQRHGRHWTGVGEALRTSRAAKTLRWNGGKVVGTDGPYSETKELLGGVSMNRFSDIDRAVEAWSKHPCLRVGDVFEIRPTDEEFYARIAASEALAAGR